MKIKKQISEQEIKPGFLSKSDAKLAINKFNSLMKKKPDLVKDGPLKAIEWLESIIKLYKTYE